jgi:hypothetical protein
VPVILPRGPVLLVIVMFKNAHQPMKLEVALVIAETLPPGQVLIKHLMTISRSNVVDRQTTDVILFPSPRNLMI